MTRGVVEGVNNRWRMQFPIAVFESLQSKTARQFRTKRIPAITLDRHFAATSAIIRGVAVTFRQISPLGHEGSCNQNVIWDLE
jgi:hypothetical protein